MSIFVIGEHMRFYGFLEYLVLWAGLELSALSGKLERNRGGEAMNRTNPGPMDPDSSDSSDFFT